jgi:hypothetical protein
MSLSTDLMWKGRGEMDASLEDEWLGVTPFSARNYLTYRQLYRVPAPLDDKAPFEGKHQL